MNAKLEELTTRLGEITDLQAAMALLGWDQQTYMPPAAVEARSTQRSTLSKILHERFTADEIGQLLDDLDAEVEEPAPTSLEASLLRITRREYERRRKLPTKLVAELSKATLLGRAAWQEARAASDFSMFLPHLEHVVELTLQKAEALGYEDRIYDALLDEFEPEMKTAHVEDLFVEMKAGLIPLVQSIAKREGAVDDTILAQDFDEERQWAFGIEVIKRLGFDFEHGRQDRSVHPFTTSFSPTDVRLTTRVYRDQVKSALFASIHEAGHGMYEQGIDRSLDRTLLSDSASLAVHESQSRMWENLVGRSREFWTYWLPRLKEYFPLQLEGVGVDALYRAFNRVRPSLIRVEADEVTYNLHIFLRFEIENLMVEGRVRLRDLPELWDAKMEEYLGIRPPDDARGVLQDVHWSQGYIGYFPTYALGNLLAAQFYRQAVTERPEIPAEIQQGNAEPLFNWLRERIHRPGARYTPAELVQRVAGGPIDTGPFLSYVRAKYSDIYGLG